MALIGWLLYLIFTLIVLYRTLPAKVWEIGSGIYLILASFFMGFPAYLGLLMWLVILGAVAIIHIEALRLTVSEKLFGYVTKSIPHLSKTEEVALNAGNTWFEESIFRGDPDWHGLKEVQAALSQEESNFLKRETHALCQLLDEWAISEAQDLPPAVWSYLKEKGFWGVVIPKKYGGKGFSARAHSEIVMKLTSRSVSTAVTMMVPNSLGPGELLVHYGTDEQKQYYLPKLACGEEIPCFALTEPEAGSDATSIKSTAVVVEKKVNGQLVLGLKITLNKRWITLAPVATLLGVAVNLSDPNGLLNGVGKEGITCVLVPRNNKQIEIGNRHLPAHQAFMNGTIRGEDIFVPISQIIGGQKNAGLGWEMLVECLSIGRSISLPALSVGAAGVAYLTCSAFGRIRRQFRTEIGQFEGIEEKLAMIGGLTYLINASRLLTLAAVQVGKKPSVASALTKYFNTELARIAMNHAMDIHGGRAVVLGPRNYLSMYYSSIPILVTVEGANIMSRNLLIFGQGSMACHPFIRDELMAIRQDDKKAFHLLIWKHIHYFMRNVAKTMCTAWTGGFWLAAPNDTFKAEYRRMTRLTYAFAWIADLSLMVLGGALKRKERLSARMADALSYLYMAMAVLHYVEQQPENKDEIMHAKWALQYSFHHAQKAMLDFAANFSNRFLGCLVRFVAFPFGQTMRAPSDKHDHQLAQLMMRPNAYRDMLKQALFLSGDPSQPVDRMEHAFDLLTQHEESYQKFGRMQYTTFTDLAAQLDKKVQEGVLSAHDKDSILKTEQARWDAIQVDEFAF